MCQQRHRRSSLPVFGLPNYFSLFCCKNKDSLVFFWHGKERAAGLPQPRPISDIPAAGRCPIPAQGRKATVAGRSRKRPLCPALKWNRLDDPRREVRPRQGRLRCQRRGILAFRPGPWSHNMVFPPGNAPQEIIFCLEKDAVGIKEIMLFHG